MRFRRLPRLYPILDAGFLEQAGIPIENFARSLRDADVRFLQYRDKQASDQVVMERAAMLRSIFPASDSCLILNDRASLVLQVGFDGVHVGQQDLSPAATRALIGPAALLGLSTHGAEQLTVAAASDANYMAIGPVFATHTKQGADPVVGLEGVRVARAITKRPVVAIGGISRDNCAAVIAAGADSVAVISDLLPRHDESLDEIVLEYFSLLQRTGEAL